LPAEVVLLAGTVLPAGVGLLAEMVLPVGVVLPFLFGHIRSSYFSGTCPALHNFSQIALDSSTDKPASNRCKLENCPFSLGTIAPLETAKSVRKKAADESMISITEKITEKNDPK